MRDVGQVLRSCCRSLQPDQVIEANHTELELLRFKPLRPADQLACRDRHVHEHVDLTEGVTGVRERHGDQPPSAELFLGLLGQRLEDPRQPAAEAQRLQRLSTRAELRLGALDDDVEVVSGMPWRLTATPPTTA